MTRNTRRLLLTVLAFALPLSVPVVSTAATVHRPVADGIQFTQEVVAPPAGPLLINVVRVDLKRPGIRLGTVLGRDVVITDEPAKGRETVREMAMRHGATVAVNGDYFPFTGDPLGLAIIDGQLVSESMPNRAVMGVTASRQVRFDTLVTVGSITAPDGSVGALDAIDRSPDAGETAILTPVFGRRSRAVASSTVVTLANIPDGVHVGRDIRATVVAIGPGDPAAPIPAQGALLVAQGKGAEWIRQHLSVNTQVTIRMDLAPSPLVTTPKRGYLASRAGTLRGTLTRSEWSDVDQAIGGGPWLVRGGKVFVDGREEDLDPTSFVAKRHPRTAVGITKNGILVIVAVDGRQPHSKGMSLPELASKMLELGCVEAINLDGGGSTAMTIDNLYVNRPSDGTPRPVADALLVYTENSVPAAPDTSEPAVHITAGETAALPTSGLSDAIWGTTDGRILVDQTGHIVAKQAGSTSIEAIQAGKRIRIPVVVAPAAPSVIHVAFTNAPNNPPDRKTVQVTVMDAYGNAIPHQRIQVSVHGGTADRSDVDTGETGTCEVEAVWDTVTGRSVTVTSGSLKPVTASPK